MSLTDRPNGSRRSASPPSLAASSSAEQQLPVDLDAEVGVLGSIMLLPDVCDEVALILREEDFHDDANRRLFQHMLAMHDAGGKIDPTLLFDRLKRSGDLEIVGGAAYVAKVIHAVPNAAHAVYYAHIVRQKATYRSLILAATEILRDAYEESQEAKHLLSQAEQKIFAILDSRGSASVSTIRDILHDAMDRIDARMRGEHTTGGVDSRFADLDQLTGGLHNSELIVLAARPSMGKCLTADAEIALTDGRVATIEQIVRERVGRMLTLNERLQFEPTTPSHFVDDGIKPVFRVVTGLGRTVTATAPHPFLTLDGWRPLRELSVGDHIAVPRRMDVFGTEVPPEHEMKLLGYLLGDGNLTGTTPRFTNTNSRLQDDFADAVDQFGGVTAKQAGTPRRAFTYRVIADVQAIATSRVRFGKRLTTALALCGQSSRACALALGVSPSLAFNWRRGLCSPSADHVRQLKTVLDLPLLDEPLRKNGKNRLMLWLQALGLSGTRAETKHIPELVFRATKECVALFLNRLFATDGWVCVLASGQAQVGYVTVSQRLARQVQHLLLRFGIIAALHEKRKKYQGGQRLAWQLDITDAQSLNTFCREIGVFGKEVAVQRVQEALATKRYQTNRDLIPREVWRRIEQAKQGMSWAELARRIGLGPSANLHQHRRSVSRSRLRRFAEVLNDGFLRELADSDVYWDRIVSIEYVGEQQVYDLTIPRTHNFVANDTCVHNTALAMNIAENVAIKSLVPVLFVSLEMSAIELADRMLCSVARVNGHRLRNGTISNEDRRRLVDKAGEISQAPLFVDDSPSRTVTEIAAAARRIRRREGRLGLIVVDYLQLIEPDNAKDPRQEQVARITRRLKGLAREMQVPILCLAQLNRQAEDSKEHRPRLSHLRECVPADTLVQLADGRRVPIVSLVGTQPTVLCMDDSQRIVSAKSDAVWHVGRRPVFVVRLASGRTVRATSEHRLLAGTGWTTLGELRPGDRLAVARQIPEPAEPEVWEPARVALLGQLIGDGSYLSGQPLRYTTNSEENSAVVSQAARDEFGATVSRYSGHRNWHQLLISGNGNRWKPAGTNRWLRALGIFGQRSFEKRVPESVFRLGNAQIALFLRHLWATDGCIFARPGGTRGSHAVYYSTTSRHLASDVAALLLRLGIVARTHSVRKQQYRPNYHVTVTGGLNQQRFLAVVGGFGPRREDAEELAQILSSRTINTNVDTLPREVFGRVKLLMRQQGVSYREMARIRGTACGGGAHFRFSPSRVTVAEYAEILHDDALALQAANDLFWDRVLEVAPDGEEDVYDLTVPGYENWLADSIVTHNSGAIEQDADVVMFVHREEYYRHGEDQKDYAGQAEVIVAKQRNGPVGQVELVWRKEFTRFEDKAPDRYEAFDEHNQDVDAPFL